MSDITGVVKVVTGQVIAIAIDGTRRLVSEGENIFTGEQIVTDGNSQVSIELGNGQLAELGHNAYWHSASGASEPAQIKDISDIWQAIASGADPDQLLEATAAGPQADPAAIAGNSSSAEGNEGHSHVVLDLTGNRVDPEAGYPTSGIDFPAAGIVEEKTIADTGNMLNVGENLVHSPSEPVDNRDPVRGEAEQPVGSVPQSDPGSVSEEADTSDDGDDDDGGENPGSGDGGGDDDDENPGSGDGDDDDGGENPGSGDGDDDDGGENPGGEDVEGDGENPGDDSDSLTLNASFLVKPESTTTTTTVTKFNGGSESADGLGFDTDSNGNIVAAGVNVVIWITEGEQNNYPDSLQDNLRIYSDGNPHGTLDKTDIFVLNSGSGYSRDGNFYYLNSVAGNTVAQSDSSAKDYIFIDPQDDENWEVKNWYTNNNSNTNDNTLESISITCDTVDENGNQLTRWINSGSNHIEEILSSDGNHTSINNSTSAEPIATNVTTYSYELQIAATLTGTGDDDIFTSFILSGLPEGATVSYNGASVVINEDGIFTSSLDDGTSSLNGILTITGADGGEIDTSHISLVLGFSSGDELYSSGAIEPGTTDYMDTIIGGSVDQAFSLVDNDDDPRFNATGSDDDTQTSQVDDSDSLNKGFFVTQVSADEDDGGSLLLSEDDLTGSQNADSDAGAREPLSSSLANSDTNTGDIVVNNDVLDEATSEQDLSQFLAQSDIEGTTTSGTEVTSSSTTVDTQNGIPASSDFASVDASTLVDGLIAKPENVN